MHSVLAEATSVQIRRGGDVDGLKIKTDVGITSIKFFNAHDPMDDAVLTTGVPIRVVMRTDGAPLFTGTVLDVASTYSLDKQTGTEKTLRHSHRR